MSSRKKPLFTGIKNPDTIGEIVERVIAHVKSADSEAGVSGTGEMRYFPLAVLLQTSLLDDVVSQDPRFEGLTPDVRLDRALAVWYGIEAQDWVSESPSHALGAEDPEGLLALARLADANTAALDAYQHQQLETVRYLGQAITHYA